MKAYIHHDSKLYMYLVSLNLADNNISNDVYCHWSLCFCSFLGEYIGQLTGQWGSRKTSKYDMDLDISDDTLVVASYEKVEYYQLTWTNLEKYNPNFFETSEENRCFSLKRLKKTVIIIIIKLQNCGFLLHAFDLMLYSISKPSAQCCEPSFHRLNNKL